jgi:hypothetical protein
MIHSYSRSTHRLCFIKTHVLSVEMVKPLFSLGKSKQIKYDERHAGFEPNLGAGLKVKLGLRIHGKGWVKI